MLIKITTNMSLIRANNKDKKPCIVIHGIKFSTKQRGFIKANCQPPSFVHTLYSKLKFKNNKNLNMEQLFNCLRMWKERLDDKKRHRCNKMELCSYIFNIQLKIKDRYLC